MEAFYKGVTVNKLDMRIRQMYLKWRTTTKGHSMLQVAPTSCIFTCQWKFQFFYYEIYSLYLQNRFTCQIITIRH